MKLLLIRHGETPWTIAKRYQGISDISLNSEGVRQAKAVARALKAEGPTRLYTSSLKRARETARWAGQALGLKPVVDSRLNEINFGQWEGSSYRELAKRREARFQKWQEGKLVKPPGGESIPSLARRGGQFLKDMLRRHLKETVAVVTHGGPIKTILFKALHAPLCSLWSFRIDPASISLLEGDSRLLQIVWTNRTSHLNGSVH